MYWFADRSRAASRAPRKDPCEKMMGSGRSRTESASRTEGEFSAAAGLEGGKGSSLDVLVVRWYRYLPPHGPDTK